MQLISINLGKEQTIQSPRKSYRTSINKLPVGLPARITSLGLVGDAISDTEHHGGVDQAVYVYGAPDYAWWSAELGRELAPGTFGENLTIAGLESALFQIGDRLQVGAVTLEVTSPRIPCSTLAAQMGDPAFVKRFRAAERPGLYCRVIREGSVQIGDPVTFTPHPGQTITLIEMYRAYYQPVLDEAALRRQLAAPIAIRARGELEAKLRKLLETK